MGASARFVPVLLAVSFAPAGCMGTFQKSWVEVSSEHFVIESDLEVDRATGALARFEAFREALEEIAFPSESQPSGRTRVVLVESQDEYREIGPGGTGGYFSPFGDLVDPEPRIVLFANGGHLVESMQHELVHRYVAFHFPESPTWLNEGLATFYSTLEIRDGKAIVGAPSSHVSYDKVTYRR